MTEECDCENECFNCLEVGHETCLKETKEGWKKEVLELVTTRNKITTSEIIDIMDDVDTWSILTILDELKEEGKIE